MGLKLKELVVIPSLVAQVSQEFSAIKKTNINIKVLINKEKIMKQVRMNALVTLTVVFLVTLALTFSACTNKKGKQPKVIKIGAILPLTGPLGYLGEIEKNAIEIAEEVLKKEGIQIKVFFGDSMGKPAEAVTVAQKLISIDQIDCFITSTTSVSRAVLPLADRNEKIIVTLCMDPSIQHDSPYAFRLYEGMEQEAETLLQYYKQKNRANNRVAVLYVNHAGTVQQMNDCFLPGFQKMNIDVVCAEPFELSDRSFKAKIDKIKHSKADSLIIIGFGFVYPTIFKELAQHKLLGKIEITGGWGFIAPNKVPPHLLEGVIVAAPEYVFNKNEKARSFEAMYLKKYGELPNFDGAFAYNAAKILVEAINKSGGNIKTASELVRTMSAYNDIFGKVEITESGGMKLPMGIGVIKQGKITPYKPEN